jgi:hypothetical protein
MVTVHRKRKLTIKNTNKQFMKRSTKVRAKRKLSDFQHKRERQGIFNAVEIWLRSKASRYKNTLILIVAIVSSIGWLLDRTLLNKSESSKSLEISIYNNRIEELNPTLKSYYQYPKYKEANINFGGSLGAKGYYVMTPAKIGEEVYLMFKIDGEIDMRTFNLTKAPNIPFSIQLKIKGEGFLVTIEKLKDDGIQVRTFQSYAN